MSGLNYVRVNTYNGFTAGLKAFDYAGDVWKFYVDVDAYMLQLPFHNLFLSICLLHGACACDHACVIVV